MKRQRFAFSGGDQVILMLARNKKALVKMSRRKERDCWSDGAARILRRLARHGLAVSWVVRGLEANRRRRAK